MGTDSEYMNNKIRRKVMGGVLRFATRGAALCRRAPGGMGRRSDRSRAAELLVELLVVDSGGLRDEERPFFD